eukprot:scaffold1297_cov368-Prasinococcus_capsulatus_cf.AAC.9
MASTPMSSNLYLYAIVAGGVRLARLGVCGHSAAAAAKSCIGSLRRSFSAGAGVHSPRRILGWHVLGGERARKTQAPCRGGGANENLVGVRSHDVNKSGPNPRRTYACDGLRRRAACARGTRAPSAARPCARRWVRAGRMSRVRNILRAQVGRRPAGSFLGPLDGRTQHRRQRL